MPSALHDLTIQLHGMENSKPAGSSRSATSVTVNSADAGRVSRQQSSRVVVQATRVGRVLVLVEVAPIADAVARHAPNDPREPEVGFVDPSGDACSEDHAVGLSDQRRSPVVSDSTFT